MPKRIEAIEIERCHFCDKMIIYYTTLSKKNAAKLLELFELLKYFKIEYEEGKDWLNRIGSKHICVTCRSFFKGDD